MSVLLAMSQSTPVEIASITIACQSQPRSRLKKRLCYETTPPAGHNRRLSCLHQAAAASKTVARLHRRTPSHASQLATTQSTLPGIQQAPPGLKQNGPLQGPNSHRPVTKGSSPPLLLAKASPLQKEFPLSVPQALSAVLF
jgi:hypothetical protein